MFGEVLIMVANGFPYKSLFKMLINIQTVIGTIPSTHFSTDNAVLFVKIRGTLGFISFPIVKTQGIWGFIGFPTQIHEFPCSSLLQLHILFYLIHTILAFIDRFFLSLKTHSINTEELPWNNTEPWCNRQYTRKHLIYDQCFQAGVCQISASKTVLKSYKW